jgi:hypothetical protein
MQRPFTQEQRTTILQGILGFVLILAVLQLWLMTATMNAYLGGNETILWPAALSSLVCVAVNIGLLRCLFGLERPTT